MLVKCLIHLEHFIPFIERVLAPTDVYVSLILSQISLVYEIPLLQETEKGYRSISRQDHSEFFQSTEKK